MGWTILAILLVANFLGLRDVVFSSSDKWLALFLLAFGFWFTFGSTAMGVAIMSMPYPGDDDDDTSPPNGGKKIKSSGKSFFGQKDMPPKTIPATIPVKNRS